MMIPNHFILEQMHLELASGEALLQLRDNTACQTHVAAIQHNAFHSITFVRKSLMGLQSAGIVTSNVRHLPSYMVWKNSTIIVLGGKCSL